MMHYRTLGRTGLQVSEIGYGAWGIGQSGWIGAQDQESLQALQRAIDLGVNCIDTALAYGGGHRAESQSKRPFQAPTSENVPSRVCAILGRRPLIFSSSMSGMMSGLGKEIGLRPSNDSKIRGRFAFSGSRLTIISQTMRSDS